LNVMDNASNDVSKELMDQLLKISVCTVTATLQELGFRNTYMLNLRGLAFPESKIRTVGRAVTLRFIPLREDLVKEQYDQLAHSPHRTALESVREGDMLVIDTGGCIETGVVGDIFTRRIKVLGGQAIIVDGCVRDLERIAKLDVPLFARGVHGGAIPRALMSVDYNRPIQCGGVAVIPGDVILADRDGVVVIPPRTVAEIVRIAGDHDDLEEMWIRMKLDEGASLHTHYPPDEEARKEYEIWKQNYLRNRK